MKKMELSEEHFNSIRCKLRRVLLPSQERPARTTLDEENEKMLVDLVAAFSIHANPLSGLEVRSLAKVVGGLRGQSQKRSTNPWSVPFFSVQTG